MASCKFEGGKCHGAIEAKALLRHCAISPDRRSIAKNKNKHIDLGKSKYNFSIMGGSDGLTYEQMAKKYDDCIAYLDSHKNKNKRKDRVTMLSIEIPVPAELPRDQYIHWFIRVSEILRKRYGDENFIDGMIHYDEEHEYVEPATKEKVWSRVHGHFMIIPAVDGKLNAKKLTSRANIKSLNREVDEMTKREFRCAFMTGEKKRSFKTVEELKEMSAYAEYQTEIKKEEAELEEKENRLRAHMEALKRREEELQEKEKHVAELQKKAEEVHKEAVRREQEAHEKLQELEKRQEAEEPEEIQEEKNREVPAEFEELIKMWERERRGEPEPDLQHKMEMLERRQYSDTDSDAETDEQDEDEWKIPFEFVGFVPSGPSGEGMDF